MRNYCPLSRPYIWLTVQLYKCCASQAIMTGSSFIGEANSLNKTHSHTYVLLVLALPHHTPHTSPTHLTLSTSLTKGGPRFPRADGRQNGHRWRRRIFLRRCVRAHLLFPLCRTGGRTTEQFEDEIHPRLRYAHRGLVAMANNGKKNSNDSQFFITLGTVKSYLMHVISPNSVLE